MNTKYKSSLRASAKRNPEEWFWRGQRCARRLLSAVIFRETAESAYRKTDSAILSVIGFYYALFHAGIAALHIDYATERHSLQAMRHTRLVSLLDSRLVQRHLLPEAFVDQLKRLRIAREYSNYVIGGKMIGDFDEPIHRDEMLDLYDKTGTALEAVLTLVTEVSDTFSDLMDGTLLSRIAVTIGDDIGDDVYSMYLGDGDEKRVVDYLLHKGLTT